jgi:hypothetical protein
MLVVQRLAGVLLQMQPLDADVDALAVRDRSTTTSPSPTIGRLVLADLIALRQIRDRNSSSGRTRLQVDLRLETEAGADRLRHAFLVDDRQHARHRRIDQRDMAVRLAAEFGRGAGEQLGVGGHLGMDFHADDDFPVAGRAETSA